MKLDTHSYGFEGDLPKERIAFKIATSAKLFDILSSGIYKDKILAVIRELSCNAYDAHVAAGKKDVPFEVQLPTYVEPIFAVTDFGTGIDPEKIGDIFWTYGESTKTNSNDYIGALGLGSKSPFAYTKSSFIVKNRYNGKEYVYFCFINERGTPDGSLVSAEDTQESNGIRVEFAVRKEDIYDFERRASRFFKYWTNTMPKFNLQTKVGRESPIVKVFEGKNWYLEKAGDKYGSSQAQAVMGNVVYPIDADSIPKLPDHLRKIASSPFVLDFKMGELNFASSREALSYDEVTNKLLVKRLSEIADHVKVAFMKEVNSAKNHVEFVQGFSNTFKMFCDSLRLSLEEGKALLVAKTDKFKFQGVEFKFQDLVNRNVTLATSGYQPFGVMVTSKRHYSNKTYFKPATTLYLHALESFTWSTEEDTSEVKKGSEVSLEWRTRRLPKKESAYRYADHMIASLNKFSVNTETCIFLNGKVRFVVNDLEAAGDVYFKYSGSTDFYVTFDWKVTKLQEVLDNLSSMLAAQLTGAEVVMLSTLPDNRPQIIREKTDKESFKLKYVEFYGRRVMPNAYHTPLHLTLEINGTAGHKEESVFTLSELKAKSCNLFVYRRVTMKELYNDSKNIKPFDDDAVSLAHHLGMLTNFVEPLKSTAKKNTPGLIVLALTPNQLAYLVKKGVKLEHVNDVIKTKITDLSKTEKFADIVNTYLSLKNVEVLKNMSQLFSDQVPAGLTGWMADTLKMYQTSSSSKTIPNFRTIALKYQLLGMYERQEAPSAHPCEKQIDKRYPMLKYMSFGHSRPKHLIDDMISYIMERDALLGN